MSIIFRVFVFVAALLALSFINNHEGSKLTGYVLKSPDNTLILPDTLREISGLAQLDSNSFACIQDENGILFIYDAKKNRIRSQYEFGGNGDYEAIARVGKVIYVLRSDGMLYELTNMGRHMKIKDYYTGVPAANSEGLCYDQKNNRLLIGCKSKLGQGSEFHDKRAIYAFDLKSKTTSLNPVYNFSVQKIIGFALENNVRMPFRKKGKTVQPILKLSTSEIGINPKTNELFLLSAADHMLFIFNIEGEIQHIENLDPVMFNKPEGVTFYDNGDMLITNEGQNKKPTLLRFNFKG